MYSGWEPNSALGHQQVRLPREIPLGLAWGMRGWGDKEDKAQKRSLGGKLLGVWGKRTKSSFLAYFKTRSGRERRLDSKAGVDMEETCMPGGDQWRLLGATVRSVESLLEPGKEGEEVPAVMLVRGDERALVAHWQKGWREMRGLIWGSSVVNSAGCGERWRVGGSRRRESQGWLSGFQWISVWISWYRYSFYMIRNTETNTVIKREKIWEVKSDTRWTWYSYHWISF